MQIGECGSRNPRAEDRRTGGQTGGNSEGAWKLHETRRPAAAVGDVPVCLLSVLRSLGPSVMPGPVMPMDVALGFCLGDSLPPLRGLVGPYEEQQPFQRLRPCIRVPADCLGWSRTKKKVAFADSQGLSLTAIHVFSKVEQEVSRSRRRGGDELQLHMPKLDLKTGPDTSLLLDFHQPAADGRVFWMRLVRDSVCLETCSLQERWLTGTVRVRNIGFEKWVRLRATFDSWASFVDVHCTFVDNVHRCQDTDTFAFVLELPTCKRVQFCICYQVQDLTFWDNNNGKNYTLEAMGQTGSDQAGPGTSSEYVFEDNSRLDHRGLKCVDMELDKFGSPRTSIGQVLGWQSWGRTVPYW